MYMQVGTYTCICDAGQAGVLRFKGFKRLRRFKVLRRFNWLNGIEEIQLAQWALRRFNWLKWLRRFN